MRGINRSPVNSPHKGQRRGALMFSLICTWINGSGNNHEVGDLRRHRAHYDVTEMRGGLSIIAFSTLRPRQNSRHFPDDMFKCIFLNENASISIKISLKFVPKGRINNIPTLVQIMAWHRPGDKPLSEPMVVSLLTHTCVTQSEWVNSLSWKTWKQFYECILKRIPWIP